MEGERKEGIEGMNEGRKKGRREGKEKGISGERRKGV